MFNGPKTGKDSWNQQTITNTEYNCPEAFGKNLWKNW